MATVPDLAPRRVLIVTDFFNDLIQVPLACKLRVRCKENKT